jgi:hypothetical protein
MKRLKYSYRYNKMRINVYSVDGRKYIAAETPEQAMEFFLSEYGTGDPEQGLEREVVEVNLHDYYPDGLDGTSWSMLTHGYNLRLPLNSNVDRAPFYWR